MEAVGYQCQAASLLELIEQFRKGNRQATDQLIETLYTDLRRLAASRMRRERGDHTWQPTALVNELYLELVQSRGVEGAANQKSAFLGLAGYLMKRLLIHHARPLYRKAEKVQLDDIYGTEDGLQTLAEIESLLDGLAQIQPDLRTVTELKVFEGFTVDEIAAKLGRSPRTIARHWEFARHWLVHTLDTSETYPHRKYSTKSDPFV
jgi:RNA polymerase sigma factor (TIGR02999 family)